MPPGHFNRRDADGGVSVRKVLNAVVWIYVAGTLQTLMTLAYFLFRFAGARCD